MVAALREFYLPRTGPSVGEWSLLTEVPTAGAELDITATYTRRDGEDRATYLARVQAAREAARSRSIDVLLIRNWASGPRGRERIAVEVKISRGDFFRDTEAKRAPWLALTHRFAYAVPAGLVTPAEVPDGCALIEVSAQPCTAATSRACARHSPRRVHWHPQAKGRRRTPSPLPEELVCYLAARASHAEATLAQPDQRPSERLAAELAALRGVHAKLISVRGQRDQLKSTLRQMADLVAQATDQRCADCGQPVKATYARYSSPQWAHRSKAHDEPCRELRTAAAAQAERDGKGAARWWFSSIEPQVIRQARLEAEQDHGDR